MLGQSFAMDSDELAAEWLRKASTVQLSAPAAKQLVDATLGFAIAVARKLKFDVMARALAAADTTARNWARCVAASLVQARSAELKLVQADSIRPSPPRQRRRRIPRTPRPTLPSAVFFAWSSTIGHRACGPWPGVPVSPTAAPPPLNSVFRRNPTNRLQLATSGGNWGDKDTARSKAARQRHAAAWYRKAEADTRLNALDKIKIENRLRLAGTTTTAADNNGKWLDLMHLIDPKKHAKVGTWKLETRQLSHPGLRMANGFRFRTSRPRNTTFALSSQGTPPVRRSAERRCAATGRLSGGLDRTTRHSR